MSNILYNKSNTYCSNANQNAYSYAYKNGLLYFKGKDIFSIERDDIDKIKENYFSNFYVNDKKIIDKIKRNENIESKEFDIFCFKYKNNKELLYSINYLKNNQYNLN